MGVIYDQPCDRIDYTLDVLPDIAVPDAKHTITLRRKPLRAFRIVHCDGMVRMLSAINFDDEFVPVTGEINDVGTNWNLTSKVC